MCRSRTGTRRCTPGPPGTSKSSLGCASRDHREYCALMAARAWFPTPSADLLALIGGYPEQGPANVAGRQMRLFGHAPGGRHRPGGPRLTQRLAGYVTDVLRLCYAHLGISVLR